MQSSWMFRWVSLVGSVVVLGGLSSLSSAQLIGNRTVGSPIGSQGFQANANPGINPQGFGQMGQQGFGVQGATQGAPAGNVSAGLQNRTSRFIRGNRARGNFVGSNRTDQTGFVGSEQALGVGRVPTAVDNLKLEAKPRPNRPLPPQPAKGMYYPRLVLDDSDEEEQDETTHGEMVRAEVIPQEVAVSSELQERIARIAGDQVTVVLLGGTAVLRGNVPSRRTAELAAQILGFEPGIDRVKSELKVAPK